MMRWIVRIFAFLLLVAIGTAGVLGYMHRELETFADTPFPASKDVVVEIEQGAGPMAVSTQLAKAGVISDATAFYRVLRFVRREGGRIKHGEFEFHEGVQETPNTIIDRLLKGEVRNVKVTFPEGLRVEEQAVLWAATGLGTAAEYVHAARDPKFAKSLGVQADSLEGYLFPDTYLVPRTTDTKAMLRYMLERFEKAWTEAEKHRLPGVRLTKEEAVTLASIVEKETGQADERPRISCVFHNRIAKDMKLQTDPTVMYAAFLATGHWDENIHKSDLERVHPYNTYAVKGLPPGPIANAGEAALVAALRPIKCNDLFFVSKNDGTHVFCPDLACHEANVEKWQREFFRKKAAQPQGSGTVP